ncbi:MAG: hypothetical protein ICV55_10960 [Coleofasciculus sp. C3-bin4]|nr:hypothetical protein [Coleofasciculus sp. C3-bin4]
MTMISPWKNLLPQEDNTASRVVVCVIFEDNWIPVVFTNLANAVRLYRQGLHLGREIFVFPCDATPWSPLALETLGNNALAGLPVAVQESAKSVTCSIALDFQRFSSPVAILA